MKKLRSLCVMLATALITTLLLAGCTMVQAQKMKNVKGTYELTSYTRTNGKTNKVTNYIEDYGYEEYLIVTGENQGYLVHKDDDTAAYSRKVLLTYTYDQEQTSRVAHVSYVFKNGDDGDDMGVTAGGLNYSKPRIYFSDLVNSDGYSYSWRKVDSATDLSYAKEKLGAIREYDWGEYEVEGVYSTWGPYWENNVGNVQEQPENPYVYYLTEIDTVAKQARIVYLKKAEGSVEESETKTITLVNGWDEIKVGDESWIRPAGWNERYDVIRPAEGLTDGSTVRYEMSRVRAEIGDDVLEEVVTEKYPVGIYSIEEVVWNNNASQAETDPESPYAYYFIEIEPLTQTVRVAYLKKAEGSEPVTETKTFTFSESWDWYSFEIGAITWNREYNNPEKFYAIVNKEGATDGSTVKYGLRRIQKEIGDEALEGLIAEKTPAPEATE